MRALLAGFFLWPMAAAGLAPDPGAELTDAEQLIAWLLADERHLTEIRFAKVVKAATGQEVLPVDRAGEVERRVLGHLEATVSETLEELNQPEHPIHQVGRINEVSGHIEVILQEKLDALEGVKCHPPVNASGRVQRSGYPDLRLIDEPSGRVFYLDPKVHAEGSQSSTFRTFYYEPRVATNKILDDAHHIIIGISHGGRIDGNWRFQGWNLVDLEGFRMRLKAEFQGNNRDIYQPEAILLRSESTPGED